MDNNSDAKQLIIDRVKQATNILVTVENNPSVDELAAALALTLMLNKLDKHATAVFSGAVPPAINFLEPNKTFENTVDSLRDFIIALDKEKADRLRYKVEDDVVKIFITPYQSTITEKDLHFSQGDFNVEVVMALGVEKRESLDRAIAAHGRILHDATVITINARDERSNLGAIDWQDGKASSICEMLVSLGETLQPKLLDTQISTALLTGIVAATDRFSNERTTPHSMTLSADLMAAGANQQLIANNLQPPAAKLEKPAESAEGKISREPAKKEGEISEESKKVEKPPEPPTDGSKGEMKVRHDEGSEEEQKKEEAPAALPIVAPASTPEPAPTKEEDNGAAAIPTDAGELSGLKDAVQSAASQPPMPLAPTSASSTQEPAKEAPNQAPVLEELTPPRITPLGQNLDSTHRANWDRLEPPTLGGTLNATSAEAEESRRREAEEEAKHNHVTLNHGGGHIDGSGLPSRTLMPPPSRTPTDYIAAPTPPPSPAVMPPNPPAPAPPAANPTLAPLPPIQQQPAPGPTTPPAVPTPPPPSREEVEKKQSLQDLEDARKAVSDALSDQPFNAANQPMASVGAQPMQNDTPAPPSPPISPSAPAGAAPAPPMPATTPGGLPPLPDFNTLPPLPPLPGAPAGGNPMQSQAIAPGTDVTAQFAPPAPSGPAVTNDTPLPPIQAPPSAPAPGQVSADPNNPNQFRIPGQ